MTSKVQNRRAAPPPMYALSLRLVTEAAARAAYDWIGRGDQKRGDEAAARAMYEQLNRLPIDSVVVIGGGERGDATDLYKGEQIGHDRQKPKPDNANDPAEGTSYLARGMANAKAVIAMAPRGPMFQPKFDIAVDPVEGITYLARGMANAMSVIAMAPRGTMFQPGPAFYMEKFVAPASIKGKIDPALPVAEKIRVLGRLLDRPVSSLVIFVLEKPRHRELVEQIRNAGARVALYPAGDVAGAMMAATPGSGIDALMGTGGTAEGILSACAIRAMGGEFQGRIDPQLESEKRAVAAAGIDTTHWRTVEELITSDQVFFCATGITKGLLLGGVERTEFYEKTESLMVSGPDGDRQFLTTHHRLESNKVSSRETGRELVHAKN